MHPETWAQYQVVVCGKEKNIIDCSWEELAEIVVKDIDNFEKMNDSIDDMIDVIRDFRTGN